MQIGILALQGGYAAHAQMLNHLGITWSYIRQPSELSNIQGLIIPGGESSTALRLLQREGLFEAIHEQAIGGMPMFGTCAGAILLAKKVVSPEQTSLGLVDVTIERNAYGRQLASRVVLGNSQLKQALEMVFIRAPRFKIIDPKVKIIATYKEEPVCIQQDHYLLATFHPELTSDPTLHQYFINQIVKA